MTLFVARYITCLFVFVLGLKAPGLVAHREDDYIHLRNDANAVSNTVVIYCLHCINNHFDCRRIVQLGPTVGEKCEHCFHIYGLAVVFYFS